MLYYHIIDEKGNLIVTNIAPGYHDYVKQCISPNERVRCDIHQSQCRRGVQSTPDGTVYICMDDAIQSHRIFKEKQTIYVSILSELKNYKSSIDDKKNRQIDRLVHDVVTYNAHTIQAFYKLVPQEELSGGIKNELKSIKKIITENTNGTANTLLRMLKNENLVKAEIAAFKKLHKQNPRLESVCHPIQKVIYLIVNTFLVDFEDKKVNVVIEQCTDKVAIDYDSVSAALTKIIDNIAKYIFPKSKLTISFARKGDNLTVVFDMVSLRVYEEEKDKIFEEGYSGLCTQKAELSGNGIGLFMAKELLRLNDIDIVFVPNVDKSRRAKFQSIPYENNQIQITFKVCK